MADKALGSLTVATSISPADLLYAVIGGNSRQISLANFFTSPTLITPILGVAAATSLAIGGATIGANALAVTGTSNFSGTLTFAAANNVRFGAAGAGSVAIGKGSGGAFFVVVNDALNNYAVTHALSFSVNTAGSYQWTSADSPGTWDTTLSRQSAGVQQFGTTANNAAGSWLATSAGLGPTPTLSASTMLNLSAGTTAISQMRFGASTAPTSPVDGDYWFDGTNFKARVSGATKTFTLI